MATHAESVLQRGRRSRRRLLWVLVGLVAVGGIGVALDQIVFSTGTNAVSSAPKDVQASVQALVSGSIPGAILYVRQGDRSYSVAAGYADTAEKVPMQASDTFPIGSTTKTYTAVLVMRLVEQGKVRLDDTVTTYLPGLLRYGSEITIRELLSHTSGLYDMANDPRFMAPYLHGQFGYTWTPQQMVGFAANKPLLFSPGTQFSYSNTNYIVLALLAERIDGKPYVQQLSDYIFKPLGLSHTSLPTSNKTLPDVHGYVGLAANGKSTNARPIDSAAINAGFGWSAADIRATAADEAAFFRGLFSGELLPKAQVAAMENTNATGGQYGLGIFPTGGNGYVWGAGTQQINTTCGRAWGHGGAFPGYYQLPISSADGSRQAVLLVNTDETRLSPAQETRIDKVLGTAYCRGIGS